jgi:TonB family protein
MNRFFVALTALVGLALSGVAFGQAAPAGRSVTFPDWLTLPPESASVNEYPSSRWSPKDPWPSGSAVVRCHRQSDGDLDHCRVISETPDNAGFGNVAALAANLSRAASPPPGAIEPDGEVDISVTFDGVAAKAMLAAPRGPRHVVTNPDWKTRPSADDLSRVWPVEATRMGVSGSAKVICYVTADGLLDRCRIVSETPDGAGFGDATLLLTRYFSMTPKTVDGQPVAGASVIFTVRFQNPEGPRAIPQQAVTKVLSTPIWAQVPALSEVDGAFPPDEVGKVDLAHIVLRCSIRRTGELYACDTDTANPRRPDFTRAAQRLVKDFKLDIASYGDVRYWEALVDVPITLIAPGKAADSEITDPTWVRSIDPNKAQALFPDAAASAGVKTGRAIVDCMVDHSGHLSACKAVSETPAGLGFGEAAIQIANVLQLNPWTLQGRPVDGDHIRLPLRLNFAPTPGPAPAAASKP